MSAVTEAADTSPSDTESSSSTDAESGTESGSSDAGGAGVLANYAMSTEHKTKVTLSN